MDAPVRSLHFFSVTPSMKSHKARYFSARLHYLLSQRHFSRGDDVLGTTRERTEGKEGASSANPIGAAGRGEVRRRNGCECRRRARCEPFERRRVSRILFQVVHDTIQLIANCMIICSEFAYSHCDALYLHSMCAAAAGLARSSAPEDAPFTPLRLGLEWRLSSARRFEERASLESPYRQFSALHGNIFQLKNPKNKGKALANKNFASLREFLLVPSFNLSPFFAFISRLKVSSGSAQRDIMKSAHFPIALMTPWHVAVPVRALVTRPLTSETHE